MSIGEHRGTAVIRRPHIELETTICGLVRVEKAIYVATADSQLHSYLQKGRKTFSLRMPAPVTNLELLTIRKTRVVNVVLAALANGEIRGYRDKELVDVIRVGEVVSALACGPYGREDNTLIVVTRSGSLLVKMLPRTATFDAADRSGGPPPEQDVPLAIPKKTRLYLEQTEREKEMAPKMHRTFQTETVRLQVKVAKTYLQLLKRGEIAGAAPPREAGDEKDGEPSGPPPPSVHLSARVQGLGPKFHIYVEIRANGDDALLQVPVLIFFDPEKYRAPRPMQTCACLVPGVQYTVLFEIECLDDAAVDQEVEIVVLKPREMGTLNEERLEDTVGETPILVSKLTMPQSELLEVA